MNFRSVSSNLLLGKLGCLGRRGGQRKTPLTCLYALRVLSAVHSRKCHKCDVKMNYGESDKEIAEENVPLVEWCSRTPLSAQPVMGPVPNFSERGSFRSINFGTSSGFSFNFGQNSERSSVSFRNFRNEFRNAERKLRSDPSLI